MFIQRPAFNRGNMVQSLQEKLKTMLIQNFGGKRSVLWEMWNSEFNGPGLGSDPY